VRLRVNELPAYVLPLLGQEIDNPSRAITCSS
jgi:hypothetical protein